MNKLFVIEETEIRGRYEPCYSHVLGIATSRALVFDLVNKRHPTLTLENVEEKGEERFSFALRGKGMAEDGEDLYFCFDINPHTIDPDSLGQAEYTLADVEQEPEELNEGD